jgi:AGCS family alanine or glycine:cation symporter
MGEFLTNLNANIIWGPPLIIALIVVGLYITFRTRFVQFTKFGRAISETFGSLFRRKERAVAKGDVSPFQALSVAMGGTVGVGNIAGVASAIAIGGPGAVFWMWISGFLGMATKFAEVVLGIKYRVREEGGPMMGGPMTYIERGLGKRWKFLAILFSFFAAIAALGIGNMVQSNSVAHGMQTQFGISPYFTGAFLLIAVGLVTVGGIKRIAHVAMVFVPFMTILYSICALLIIFMKIGHVPDALGMIFKYAFTPLAPAGGFAGAALRHALRQGMAKGVFSNEAGLGSAPMAHATAITDHPARQGLWGIIEVFIDTIVMCTLTALAILTTGVWNSGAKGAELTMLAFKNVFGSAFGFSVVVISMVLTAYDTMLAWCFYGESCASYLFGKRARFTYRVLFLPFVAIGAIWKLDLVWDVSETMNGLMAIPNLIALFALSGIVVKAAKDFFNARGHPKTSVG